VFRSWALLLLAFLASSPLAARDLSPAQAHFVAEVRAVEAAPAAPDARDRLGTAFAWLTETKEVSLNWCSTMLLDVAEADRDISSGLLLHSLLSAAVFVIEHPDQQADSLVVARAGLQGALRYYKNLRRASPSSARAPLDALLEREAAGTLDEYLIPTLKGCK